MLELVAPATHTKAEGDVAAGGVPGHVGYFVVVYVVLIYTKVIIWRFATFCLLLQKLNLLNKYSCL